jgi:hypothetical protein
LATTYFKGGEDRRPTKPSGRAFSFSSFFVTLFAFHSIIRHFAALP